ncbi:PQLC1, partial [Cordylochernes scorpioides]
MENFSFDYTLSKNIITNVSSLFMIFGGVLPFIPQYLQIKRTQNADGFSTYVFGHHFEFPLLFQSIVMILAMLRMIHLCVRVKTKDLIIPGKHHTFKEFNTRQFWGWTDFWSYLEFLILFTLFSGMLMYSLLDYSFAIEVVGFLSVFIESLIGLPQFYQNLQNKSTVGM